MHLFMYNACEESFAWKIKKHEQFAIGILQKMRQRYSAECEGAVDNTDCGRAVIGVSSSLINGGIKRAFHVVTKTSMVYGGSVDGYKADRIDESNFRVSKKQDGRVFGAM